MNDRFPVIMPTQLLSFIYQSIQTGLSTLLSYRLFC